jgi:hypothetical protein
MGVSHRIVQIIIIKNKLHKSLVIRETNLLSDINLLSLINLLLAYAYCSTILSNHGLIRHKKSSRKVVAICAISYFFSLYLILHTCVQTSDMIDTKL